MHSIPEPLRDRMEVITVSGYTDDEKVDIALKYLLPKQLTKHGLNAKDVSFTGEGVRMIVCEYTKEAGLRNLERTLAKICRKVAKEKLEGNGKGHKVSRHNMHFYLGSPLYRREKAQKEGQIGVATGLAWTEVGGAILPVEVSILPGRGALTLTGKMGEVMQESAKAALSYVRSISVMIGTDANFYRKTDIHIHIPEGAIPKDGPSAGITLAVALVSAVSGIPVKSTVAMTGEITLRGRILAIGGLKEKLLAAGSADIKTVIIPRDNMSEFKEFSKKITRSLKVICADHIDQVLKIALSQAIELNGKDTAVKNIKKSTKSTPRIEEQPNAPMM
jgi:ATP-dependent Lon protease